MTRPIPPPSSAGSRPGGRLPALALLLAAAFALTGCGGEEGDGGEGGPATTEETTEATTGPARTGETTEETTTADTTTEEEAATDAWPTCENEQREYSLRYPEGWATDSPGPRHRCRWFDREPFEVDDPSEPPLTAIAIRDTIGSFQQAARQLENPFGERPIARDGLELDGVQAIRFETELTEDFRYPEGTRRYGYVVDHGGDAFWIETHDVPGEGLPYDENRNIVDEVVRTVEFD